MMYFCSARLDCRWFITIAYRVGRPHTAFRGKYLAQLRALLPVSTNTSTTEGPLGAACSPVPLTARWMDVRDATPRPTGRRRRQARVTNAPPQTASRITEMDPEMVAAAVVLDCHPALLPVSLDVSGIDMPVVRSSGPLAKTDVARPSYEQPCKGVDLLSLICPELGVAPLFDPGTDVEDELLSPVVSLMVIGHGVALLPEQVEEDVDLAQVLAEFRS